LIIKVVKIPLPVCMSTKIKHIWLKTEFIPTQKDAVLKTKKVENVDIKDFIEGNSEIDLRSSMATNVPEIGHGYCY
jgi:predicted nuclease of restriction endonuclease-like (RecB) superfamily